MSRITPAELAQLPDEAKAMVENAERLMGFVPNDALVMAHRPAILEGMWSLVAAVYGSGKVDAGLKRLVGEAASRSAGCSYCSVHAAHGARAQGVSAEKIAAVWNSEDSPLFDDAERAAIQLAKKAAQVPNLVGDGDLDLLREHFTDPQIVEIVAVIALFGFLNRWNSTLATTLEPAPSATLEKFDLQND